MARMLFGLGKILLFSRRHKNFRRGFLPFFANALILACVVFALEIVLILLGTGDVFLPIAHAAHGMLKSVLF